MVTITKVVDNGDPADKIDILVMGDGFDSSTTDQNRFDAKVQDFINKFFAIAPFDVLKTAFNVYKAEVVSNDSGIDRPDDNITRDTALNTSYGSGDLERLITATDGGVAIQNIMNQAAGDYSAGGQDYGAVVVLINDVHYGGGAAGFYTTTSIGKDGSYDYAGFVDIVAHELGHSLGYLGDEYEYNGDKKTYTGSEPSNPNLTIETQRNLIKWKDHIDASTPLPTYSKGGACDAPNKSATTLAGYPEGTVGLFEGGKYYNCGIYRPEGRCMMRALGYVFCKVCNLALIKSVSDRGAICFIATAAYGSELDPHVMFLRNFRDDVVLRSRYRRGFEDLLDIYYRFSPPIAEEMKRNEFYKNFMKYTVVWPTIALIKAIVFLAKLVRGKSPDKSI
ncbi:MAG: hypothetical protein JSV43_02220 [Methanobacteriota archaeon]|nr:MAG: hypothetical protein JSV43_02220 [Euryarchaeota archaeon]